MLEPVTSKGITTPALPPGPLPTEQQFLPGERQYLTAIRYTFAGADAVIRELEAFGEVTALGIANLLPDGWQTDASLMRERRGGEIISETIKEIVDRPIDSYWTLGKAMFELSEELRERPRVEQLGLLTISDPFIVRSVLKNTIKIAPRFGEAAELVYRNLQREVLLRQSTASGRFAASLGGTVPEHMGIVPSRFQPMPRPVMEAGYLPIQYRNLATEPLPTVVKQVGYHAPGTATGTRFVGSMRDFESVMGEVVHTDSDVVKWLAKVTGINPSVAAKSPVAKAVIAYQRQSIAAEELVEVAVSAAVDSHAQRYLGRFGDVLPINREGFYGTTGKRWEDVFSQPQLHDLTSAQRSLIDDYVRTIQEAEATRVSYGLKARGVNRDGWFYVPRQVEGIRGIELRRPSSPGLERFYDEATEGAARGVNYSRDPRANLHLHLRQAFNEIVNKQLSDATEPFSITYKQLVKEPVVNRLTSAIKNLRGAETAARRRVQVEAKAAGKAWMPSTYKRKVLQDPDVISAKVNYDASKKAYSKAMEAARKAEIAPGELFGRAGETIPIDLWRNRFFMREDAEALVGTLGKFGGREQAPNIILRGVETIANQIRFLATVGDLAMPFIQGLPVLARDPVVWARMTGRHYQAFLDPTVQARLIRENLDEFQWLAKHAVTIGDPEFFAALRPGQGIPFGRLLEFLPRGDEARNVARLAGRQTFGRFQATYNTGLGISRAYLLKALRKTWDGTDAELAALLRNMTGGLDSRALGVGPSRRALESVYLAMSPRLLRSTVALMSDAVRAMAALPRGAVPTARQVESFRVMANYLAGVHGIYVVSGLALGKDWDEIKEGLNPLNGKKYLSHNINGSWVGVGGQIRAITQFMTRMTSVLTEAESVGNLIKADPFENPIISFYYSRGAPGLNVVGTVVEGITGLDMRPYENIDSLPDIFTNLGKDALPFTLQGIMEGEGALSSLAGFVGARTSPGTPAEERDAARASVMDRDKSDLLTMMEIRGTNDAEREALAKGDFQNVGVDVRAKVDEDPVVRGRIDALAETQREKQIPYRTYKDERDALITKYSTRITEAAERYGPGERFTEVYTTQAKLRHEALAQHREDNAEKLEFLEELDPSVSRFDTALERYYELQADPLVINGVEQAALNDPGTGEFNYDESDRRKLILEREYGQSTVRAIQEHVHREDPQLVKDRRDDLDYMRDYFETTQRSAESMGILPLCQEYLQLKPIFRRNFLDVNPDLEFAFSIAADEKELMRDSDPELRRRLIKWDYWTPGGGTAAEFEAITELEEAGITR